MRRSRMVLTALLLLSTAAILDIVGMPTIETIFAAGLRGAGCIVGDVAPSEFADAMERAMDRMMADMHIAPTGDVDRDFVSMMVPHHQGAIDMAVAVLQYGKNPQLKRIAQEIIIEQQQEIEAMKLAVGDPLPPLTSAPTQPANATSPKRR